MGFVEDLRLIPRRGVTHEHVLATLDSVLERYKDKLTLTSCLGLVDWGLFVYWRLAGLKPDLQQKQVIADPERLPLLPLVQLQSLVQVEDGSFADIKIKTGLRPGDVKENRNRSRFGQSPYVFQTYAVDPKTGKFKAPTPIREAKLLLTQMGEGIVVPRYRDRQTKKEDNWMVAETRHRELYGKPESFEADMPTVPRKVA